MHREASEHTSLANRRAEEGSAALITDAGCGEIFIDVGFKFVVRRHVVPLAALFAQSEPPTFAFGVVVLNGHADDGAVAQTDHARGVDALEELARLVGYQHRSLAALHHMLRPAHRMRRVCTDHPPVTSG